MAAVLTRSRPGRAESRLSARFQHEVVPGLAALEGARRRYRLGYGAALAAMLVGIFLIFLWVGDLHNALFAGGVVVAIGFVLMQLAQRGYGVQARRAVMPAICEAIGDIRHDAGVADDLDLDGLARIGLVPSHNRQQLDDVFCGHHRATGFTMAEVRLRRVRRYRRRGSRTVFRGLIMAIAMPRPAATRILIASDAGRIGNRLEGWVRSFGAMQRVALPDQSFEAHFEVYADRPEAALATMTPELCANLAALAHDGAPFEAAISDGRLFVALPKRGDLFRIGSLFRSTDALEEDAARVLHDVQIVHRLIDYLQGDRPRPERDVRAPQRASHRQDREPVVRC